MNDYIEDFMAVMADVKTQLETGKDKFGEGEVGMAYIDWGVGTTRWQNCPGKMIADRVASELQRGGYRVYVQRMGYGDSKIPRGTPACYRVYADGKSPNGYMDEFEGY